MAEQNPDTGIQKQLDALYYKLKWSVQDLDDAVQALSDHPGIQQAEPDVQQANQSIQDCGFPAVILTIQNALIAE